METIKSAMNLSILDCYNPLNIRRVIDFLNGCRDCYYNKSFSPIPDSKYDELFDRLEQFEKDTGLIYADSPTQTVGWEAVSALKKQTHNHLMLSLPKSKNFENIKAFLGKEKPFLMMLKLDGLTCSLRYINGELVSAETRGDGEIGEDILHNILTLKTVPKKIPYKDELIIDGEVVCPYTFFKHIDTEYKNIRNYAAGSIRLLDANECRKRHLEFIAWEVIKGFDSCENLSDKLEALAFYGFKAVYRKKYPSTDSLTLESAQEWLHNNVKGCYPIDGLVFKFDNLEYSNSLGRTAHHFNNAIAYKFYDEEYSTKLVNIEWTMGRSGQICPVAVFETIDIDGTAVSRAGLSNLSIMKKTLGEQPFVGQEIIVTKRNQIIPKVEKAKDINGNWI